MTKILKKPNSKRANAHPRNNSVSAASRLEHGFPGEHLQLCTAQALLKAGLVVVLP